MDYDRQYDYKRKYTMSSRDNFSYNDMDQWLNEKRVTEIECLVPDLTGVARGMRLPEAVLGMTITGNCPTDDAAYERAISSIDRDMILRADPNTITLVPWATDTFSHYIGGLQRYMPAAMAIVAPYVTSYRRITTRTASFLPAPARAVL